MFLRKQHAIKSIHLLRSEPLKYNMAGIDAEAEITADF